jgi:hypothetical protein
MLDAVVLDALEAQAKRNIAYAAWGANPVPVPSEDLLTLIEQARHAAKAGEDLEWERSEKLLTQAHLRSANDRAKAAEAECLEQARLNGMGSEREAALHTKLRQAEARAALLGDHLNTVEKAFAERLTEAEVLADKLAEAEALADKLAEALRGFLPDVEDGILHISFDAADIGREALAAHDAARKGAGA